MNKKKCFVTTATSLAMSLTVSLALVLSACGKKSGGSGDKITSGSNTQVVTPVANHTTKAPDLGVVKSFSLMAYVSITSAPTSSITGKVGLKPGARSLISLTPAEVTGGSVEIYAGDDSGDQQSYLTMAREDLIAAYKNVAGRTTDKDKLEAYNGDLGGKILPAGTYRLSSGANIGSDMTIEGTDTDVFLFQVDGDLNLAAGAHMVLSGGAQAKNVYWQVSGRVILGSNSVATGTIMNQLTAELKPNAQVNGRVLCKNGKVLLSQNTITKPE